MLKLSNFNSFIRIVYKQENTNDNNYPLSTFKKIFLGF